MVFEVEKLMAYLNDDKIQDIVRNHFAKRLLDASEEYWHELSLTEDDKPIIKQFII